MRRLLILLVACGGASHLPASPVVDVSERGAEPRELLRYHPRGGTTERAELTYKARSRAVTENTVLERGRLDTDLPSVRIRGPVTVSEVSPTGNAVLSFEATDIEVLDDVVEPRARSAAMAAMAGQRGKRITWRRKANGETAAIDGGELADRIRELAIVFPDEPVGIGATWQIRSTFTNAAGRWSSTVTCHLLDRTETSVTVDADVELRAGDQVLSAEPNATRRLTAGWGSGKLHAVIALRGVVPGSSSSATVGMRLLVTRRHLRVISVLTVETLISIAPVP